MYRSVCDVNEIALREMYFHTQLKCQQNNNCSKCNYEKLNKKIKTVIILFFASFFFILILGLLTAHAFTIMAHIQQQAGPNPP